MPEPANAHQVGGTHYKTKYEHWDFVLNCGLGYLEGCATKYITRWRLKGTPKEDLGKALHYVEKLIESAGENGYQHNRRNQRWLRQELVGFCKANDIRGDDLAVVVALTTWETTSELVATHEIILKICEEAITPAPVPATDSNKHAERSIPRFTEERTVDNHEGA